MAECPIPLSILDEKIRRHADPSSPPPLRLMAAKGLVPMGPRDMVTVLCCLSYDPDAKIAEAAAKSLMGLPSKIILGALADPELNGAVLDHLARHLPENENYLEAILLHKETPDETFAYLASRTKDKILGIIVNNQVRILRHPPIARAILDNPNALKSQIDSLMDFAVRTGMDFSGLEAFEEAKKRILARPPDAEEAKRIQKIVEESIPKEMLEEEEVQDESTLTPEQIEKREKKRQSILSRLYTMTPAQKLVLAQKGNKTVRSALIRDHNRVVATAAIRNPGITDAEIISVAMSRSVVDDVIRIICTNREWTRSYAVKKALVENPKTPIAYSLRFLSSLRKQDLKHVAQNKNIPTAVATAAKKMLERSEK